MSKLQTQLAQVPSRLVAHIGVFGAVHLLDLLVEGLLYDGTLQLLGGRQESLLLREICGEDHELLNLEGLRTQSEPSPPV